jgi:ABC-type sugar transport system ATPase subunit
VAAAVGIELEGLVKSFGDVRAVRGIDVSIAPDETVALLGPNGAGKSTTIDMLLGLLRPDSGSVSVFGQSASRAVDAGAVGAMLQTGGLIRDLSVRELVAMMASLYPSPLNVDVALEEAGIDDIGGQRTQKLSGARRNASATRSHSSAIPSCSCSTSRRWRWTSKGGMPSGPRCVSSRPAGRPCCSRLITSRRPTPMPTASC